MRQFFIFLLLTFAQIPISAVDSVTVDSSGDVTVTNDLIVDGTLQVGTGSAITTISDDDTLSAASATQVATQRAVKAYADAKADGVHGNDHINTGADPIPNAVASGTSGLMSGMDKAKLDSVEAGAAADQTDMEIEAAYNNQVAAASQAEMEAGTEAGIRRMSPLRVAQAIESLAPASASGTVRVEATSDAGQALTADTTVIQWEDESIDANGAWDGSTFTAPADGLYAINVQYHTNNSAIGSVHLYLNGAKTFIGVPTQYGHAIFTFMWLSSGDAVTFRSQVTHTRTTLATNNFIHIAGWPG